MNKPEPSGFWDDAEIISSYSRAQAIADGVLVDVSSTSREAGFKVPVAVTATVWAMLTPSDADGADGQSIEGRLWDLLNVLRVNARAGDMVHFDLLLASSGKLERVALKAVIGPGDEAEPVITVMLPNED
jgi:hypothetical protein